jgi:biopolymer transport protein ExbB/TolQ
MNFIFGIIIMAMFILALRVIWATAFQLLVIVKNGLSAIRRHTAGRSAGKAVPVIMPRISQEVDWEAMSETVRREIQRRNSGSGNELDRLELQYQAKQKTIKLYEAEIEIAKLERELHKIKPVGVSPEPEVKKRRKAKTQPVQAATDDPSSKTAQQVFQLREALKGSGTTSTVNQPARH